MDLLPWGLIAILIALVWLVVYAGRHLGYQAPPQPSYPPRRLHPDGTDDGPPN